MIVFITGATGWIGSATVTELIGHGHDVVGLARTDEAAEKLRGAGAAVHLGDLDDLDSLRRGAASADGVIHLANKHDWADPDSNDRTERAAVEAVLSELAGTHRPFVIANGLSDIVSGRSVLESDPSPAIGPDSDRGGSENLALSYAERGVRAVAARFAPSVHGVGDWGFVNWLTAAARERGVSGYVGDGSAEWSAVHRSDAARLLRLGLERAPAGTRLHAVAEERVSTKAIAEAIAASLDLPVEPVEPARAAEHFGVVGHFFAQTLTGSSAATRALLDWEPTGPQLLDEIRDGAYTIGSTR